MLETLKGTDKRSNVTSSITSSILSINSSTIYKKIITARQVLRTQVKHALEKRNAGDVDVILTFAVNVSEMGRTKCAACDDPLETTVNSTGICAKCTITVRRLIAPLMGYKATESLIDECVNHSGDIVDSSTLINNLYTADGALHVPDDPWDPNEEYKVYYDQSTGKRFWHSTRTGHKTWVKPHHYELNS
jgi:hypothetical protein